MSLRAAKLAAAGTILTNRIQSNVNNRAVLFYIFLAIAVLINRLNMSSVTVAVDGTLFRHHEQFKQNLSRTLGRLVLRAVSSYFIALMLFT